MKKELYSCCEICKKPVYSIENCAEIMVGINLYFFDSIDSNAVEPFVLGAGAVTICAGCITTKNAIKKAIKNRLVNSKYLYNLLQLNFDNNKHVLKELNLNSKNNALIKLKQRGE
jgi:site-specific DNA-adenine methylase